MQQFINWEKISKIFVVISLLLNLFLTIVVLSMLGDLKSSLKDANFRLSVSKDGRYTTFKDGNRVQILDTRTGKTWYP